MRYLQEYLGETLREERSRKDLTVRELSELANVSPSHISDVERGKKNISGELLDSIVRGLGISIKELLLKSLMAMEEQEKNRRLM